MPRPSHSSRFYHPHNSGWGLQIMDKCKQRFVKSLEELF
jgi:hypothetical protein